MQSSVHLNGADAVNAWAQANMIRNGPVCFDRRTLENDVGLPMK